MRKELPSSRLYCICECVLPLYLLRIGGPGPGSHDSGHLGESQIAKACFVVVVVIERQSNIVRASFYAPSTSFECMLTLVNVMRNWGWWKFVWAVGIMQKDLTSVCAPKGTPKPMLLGTMGETAGI